MMDVSYKNYGHKKLKKMNNSKYYIDISWPKWNENDVGVDVDVDDDGLCVDGIL
jgi:hypothetical protein